MQAFYDSVFTREMGCTEVEWLSWLPAAIGEHQWQRMDQTASVDIQKTDDSSGHLSIQWQEASPRQIALIRLPRLLVNFKFDGLDDEQRFVFMKRFDLYMHRGGG